MKYDWKKNDKDLYGVKNKPVVVTVPCQKFITISGEGNPNDEKFSEKVGALYSLTYALKMNYKKQPFYENISDYTVFPLEGKWSKPDKELIKDNLIYTIMIQQPYFITEEYYLSALEKVKNKKPNSLYEDITFEEMSDGLSIEILHTGSYDTEPESFDKMDKYIEENNLKRTEVWHREIYLNNLNRTKKENLKTILRYCVR